MRTMLPLALLSAALAGCSSFRGPHQEYVAPRVVGQVFDARTRVPVPNAWVRHAQGASSTSARRPTDQRGAEQLLDLDGVKTDRDGWFNLPGEKSFFFLFGSGSGYFTTIHIEHPDYLTLRTNVAPTSIANVKTDRGPASDAGSLFLQPRASARSAP